MAKSKVPKRGIKNLQATMDAMNVLVVYDGPACKPLADAIAQGAQELKATVTIKATGEKPALTGYDFVFAGGVLDRTLSIERFLAASNLSKAKMALFCIKKASGTLEGMAGALQAKGAQVETNTFSAQLDGPLAFAGVGKIKDADLIRARGFGERTLNVAFDLGIGRNTEKSDRIKGYLK